MPKPPPDTRRPLHVRRPDDGKPALGLEPLLLRGQQSTQLHRSQWLLFPRLLLEAGVRGHRQSAAHHHPHRGDGDGCLGLCPGAVACAAMASGAISSPSPPSPAAVSVRRSEPGSSCRSGRCWRAVPVGQNLVAGTAASAVLGGLGSVAAGGKFADGAVTASFGYLLNAVLHVERSVKLPDAVQCYLCKLLVCIGGAYAVGIAISYPSGYAVLAGREKSDWDLGWFTTKDINVNVPLQTQPSSSWFHKQIFSFGVGKNSDGFDSFSGQSSFAGGTLGIFSAEQSFRSDDGKPYGGTLRIGAPGSSGYAGVATTCVRSWSGARYGC